MERGSDWPVLNAALCASRWSSALQSFCSWSTSFHCFAIPCNTPPELRKSYCKLQIIFIFFFVVPFYAPLSSAPLHRSMLVSCPGAPRHTGPRKPIHTMEQPPLIHSVRKTQVRSCAGERNCIKMVLPISSVWWTPVHPVPIESQWL